MHDKIIFLNEEIKNNLTPQSTNKTTVIGAKCASRSCAPGNTCLNKNKHSRALLEV